MTDTRFGHRDPNARGYYGEYGGKFVPETLVAPVEELQQAYLEARADPAFLAGTRSAARSTTSADRRRVYEAARLRASLPKPAARIFLKREDLAHTGAHKINNALGQALLARRMGKTRIVAETGAGQHGVATATVCALLGLECHVYMGADDMARQALNVVRMRLLGATVRGVSTAGSRTLKDAINEAMRDWVTNVTDSYYLLGSVLGPHPYPLMVREFQSVIGREAREQITAMNGRLPDAVVACVGGGSNALGIFDAFIADTSVRLIGVEAGGEALAAGRHAARFAGGFAGVLQGTRTYVLQDANGNIELTHSISAGLDYAAVGPEHAWLQDLGRAGIYVDRRRRGARARFSELARTGRHHPGARVGARDRIRVHAGAGARADDAQILVNLSGRGDKDVQSVARYSATEGGGQLASRIADRLRAHSRREAHRARDLRDGRRPGPRAFGRYSVRARSRGRRRAGGRHSVFRAARRRPGHSARDRASAGGRRDRVGACSIWSSVCGRGSRRRSCSSPMRTRCSGWAWTRLAIARATAGVDGVLVLDLPIEEAGAFRDAMAARGHRHDFSAEPDDDRRAHAAGGAAGPRVSVWHLAARRDGHARRRWPMAPRRWPRRMRAATSLPIALGFGISSPEHVRQIGRWADAAVVGAGSSG